MRNFIAKKEGPLHPAPKPKGPPKPETIKPTDNPKDSFKGKAVWKQASTVVSGEKIFEEIYRRIQMSNADTLSDYLDELSDHDNEDEWVSMYKTKLNTDKLEDEEIVEEPERMTKEKLFDKADDEFEEVLKKSNWSFRRRIALRQERNTKRAGAMKNGSTPHRR
jgi:hypothetical protein